MRQLARSTLRLVACAGSLLCGTLGCERDSHSPGERQHATSPLSCTPNSPRTCPCTGGGTGTQLCAGSGESYGPCNGCVKDPTQGTDNQQGSSDASTPKPDTSVDASNAPSFLDAGSADAAVEQMDASNVDPGRLGTSCGVGLPVTCSMGTEKCCVRSLATDSCIDVDARCTCDAGGCTTFETHCDGPEDCDDGQVCCGTLQDSSYLTFSCRASCEDTSSQRIACHQTAPACPSGTLCANSQLLTNLQTCIDPATIKQ